MFFCDPDRMEVEPRLQGQHRTKSSLMIFSCFWRQQYRTAKNSGNWCTICFIPMILESSFSCWTYLVHYSISFLLGETFGSSWFKQIAFFLFTWSIVLKCLIWYRSDQFLCAWAMCTVGTLNFISGGIMLWGCFATRHPGECSGWDNEEKEQHQNSLTPPELNLWQMGMSQDNDPNTNQKYFSNR